jgi:hypothetical protein
VETTKLRPTTYKHIRKLPNARSGTVPVDKSSSYDKQLYNEIHNSSVLFIKYGQSDYIRKYEIGGT